MDGATGSKMGKIAKYGIIAAIVTLIVMVVVFKFGVGKGFLVTPREPKA